MYKLNSYDAIVIGSGPNGLSAAITIAQKGCSVLLVEAAQTIGGGMRTTELIQDGFVHDVCSSVYPLIPPSIFFRNLLGESIPNDLIKPPVALAHAVTPDTAVAVYEDLEKTIEGLGVDGKRYGQLIRTFLPNAQGMFEDILSPYYRLRNPLTMLKFAWHGTQSAVRLARKYFELESTRGMFAGMAAHSILPLDQWLTAGVGIMFCVAVHANGWPIVRGGAGALSNRLAEHFKKLGGEIKTDQTVRSLSELPSSRAILFDTSAAGLSKIAGEQLPLSFHRKLSKLRLGPGICKVDWTLSGPVPWKAEACRQAGTVHLAGGLYDVANHEKSVYQGKMSPAPFVLFTQPSVFDPSRAPDGKHVGWAYCHVPHGWNDDVSSLIEGRIETFAPGFKDQIIGRHVMTTSAMQTYNANYVGGDISAGVMNWKQALFRPTFRLNPYSTPNPKLFLCSAATPPGPGVHGMCGYYAASTALRNAIRKS